MKTAIVTIYLFWVFILTGIGAYIIHNMMDRSNPESFISNLERLKEATNANPEVPGP